MWKNRLGYILTAGAMFCFCFFFSEPFLLYAGTPRILVALVVGIGMHQECRSGSEGLKVGKACAEAKSFRLKLAVRTQKSPWLCAVSRWTIIQNEMFQTMVSRRD